MESPAIDSLAPDRHEPGRFLPKDFFLYRGDVVRLRAAASGGEPMVGVVREVAGDSDSESSISDDDDSDSDNDGDDDGGENNEDNGATIESDKMDIVNGGGEEETAVQDADYDPLPDGQCRVIWKDGSLTAEKVDSLIVLDRDFIHGDMVASVSDPTGPLGLVIDVDIVVDLQSATGDTVTQVSSRDIRTVTEVAVGDYVVSGPWLGRVDEVLNNVTVLFDDGSVCKVVRADPLRLRTISKTPADGDGSLPYYPGQRVRAVSSSVFRSSKWLFGLWKPSRLEGTVTKVETASAVIYWIVSAHCGNNQTSVPPEELPPSKLTPLSCFTYANWQFGDWCLLRSPASLLGPSLDVSDDSTVTVAEHVDQPPDLNPSKHSQRKKQRKVVLKGSKRTRRKEESSFEKAYFIARTTTTVDVAWQDGRKEFGVCSTALIPIHSLNEHEFFPEQYVQEKPPSGTDETSEAKQRIGVVRSVDAKEQTVVVRWIKLMATRPEEPREFDSEEVVSAYELDKHPDYDYCYGDIVVRLPLEPHCPNTEAAAGLSVDEDPAFDLSRLSWVGHVVGLQDGYVEVKWGDNTVSVVGPHEIFVVDRGDDDGDSLGGEVSDGGASWETVDENEVDVFKDNSGEEASGPEVPTATDDASTNKATHGDESEAGRGGPFSAPFAAFSFVTKLASNLFSRRRQGDSSADAASSNEESRPAYSEESEAADSVGEEDESRTESGAADVVALVGTVAAGDATDKHFDILQSPPDHHFIAMDVKAAAMGSRKWAKKVQQEWTILEKNLPDAIYVRVYEDRMDLMRAVIVGASGTPYQDGLFFFDFQLTADFPEVPPLVYYHSGGLRLNPNLYVDGKVCLSLLNTWTGRGNEVWDPSSSSILQVLVSLQGLVLNSEPYFNEAGYERQVGTIEGEKNSLPYSENTYLLNLKSMIYIMRRPPMQFEEFVKDHFCKRGHYILKACQAYQKGHLVGTLDVNASPSPSSSSSSSAGFRLALAKLFPRVMATLQDVGADCDVFRDLQT